MEKIMVKKTEILVGEVLASNDEYCVLLKLKDDRQSYDIVIDVKTAEQLISALNKANMSALGGNLRKMNFKRLQTVRL